MTEAEREFISLIIGHRVRQARRTKRMSQEKLAQGLGSQSMISLIEGGHQFPLPDVILTLAHRLEDPVLIEYAHGLETNALHHFSVSLNNEEDLLSILVNHRGRWHSPHERIASQLCHHYYATKKIDQVQYLCKLIIHHASHNPLRAEAFFFLGSSYLHQHKFQDAEYWLKQAESLFDHLTDNMRGRLSYNLGYAYTYLDIQVLALWYASRAVEIFNRSHDFVNQGTSLGLLGTIQTHLGRLNEAKQSLIISLDILRRWAADSMNEARILTTLAEVCWLLGQSDEASKHVVHAQVVVDPDDYLCKADIHRLQAHLALEHEKSDEAIEDLNRGLEAALIANDPHSLGQLHLLSVQMFADKETKLTSAQSAFQVTRETNHHILHALAAECSGNLIASDNPDDERVKYYMQEALNSYRTYVHKNSRFNQLIDELSIHHDDHLYNISGQLLDANSADDCSGPLEESATSSTNYSS